MQIYVLNTSYDIIGMIDEYESALWIKKHNDTGEAELYLPAEDEYILTLQKDFYLYRFDDDMLCQIKGVEIQTDVEDGDYLLITATDIGNRLGGRIVRGQLTASGVTNPLVYSGTVANFIKKLLVDNVINPPQAVRKISNFVIDESNFASFTEKIETSVVAEDLLQLIKSTCKAYNYGFRVSLDINTKKLVFRLYKGKNKATTQSNEYVEFSPAFANILSSDFKVDNSNYKNVAYVGYKNIAGEFAMLSIFNGSNEPTGENRKEIYIDGTGTSRTITYEQLIQLFPTAKRSPASGGTKGYYYITIDNKEQQVATFEVSTSNNVSEEKLTVTDYTYLLLIRMLGYNALAENVETQEFGGAVDTIDTYEYKKDYDLGDVVKVINKYGIEAEAQITEIIESDDNEDGYQVEPKFEFKEG